MNKAAYVCCLIVSVLLTWQAIIGVSDMIEFDDTAFTLPIPLWPFSTMIAISGMMMIMQSLLMLFDRSGRH